MSVRKTIQWILLIVLGAGVCAGGYAYWMWSNANRMLLDRLRTTVARIVPEWNVTIGSARFDWHRRVHVYDLTLKSKDGRETIARVPEIVILIDREKFAEQQIVDVQQIRILRAEVNLVRDAGGKWNWQKLPPPRKSPSPPPLPEWVFSGAVIHVRLDQADGSAPATFDLRETELRLVPAARREFMLQGTTLARQAGRVQLSGRWHLDTKAWTLDGQMQNIPASGELLGLAVGASPELRANVGRLEKALWQLTPAEERRALSPPPHAVPKLGAAAVLDIGFHLRRDSATVEPQFDIEARFRQGTIDNPALPFPLREVAGKVHWTNRRVVFENVSARNGSTQIRAAGIIERVGTATPCRISLSAENLPLNEALRQRLIPRWRKLYDTVQPGGFFDLQGELSFDGVQKWRPHHFQAVLRNASFRHTKFPYPFTGVSGTVVQQGERLLVNLKGQAGRQPALLTGTVLQPGPTAATQFDLFIQDFHLDDAFRAACRPRTRKTLAALNLNGRADVHVRATQKAGPDRTVRLLLTADLKNCALEYERFPYRLSRLAGRVTFDSQSNVWSFSDLQAVHGTSRLSGSATLSREQNKPVFDLSARSAGASFDQSLYRALPVSLQKLWDELSPSGEIDVTVRLHWEEGRPVEIILPDWRIRKGSMLARSFPYLFENVEARLAYASQVVRILSFSARHDTTRVRATGFVETSPRGEWRLRLVDFLADDLQPDRDFRQALKGDLKNLVEELDPQGPVSVSGMLEFRGTGVERDPVTAAWDLKMILSGNSLNAGPRLSNLHGEVNIRGTWDGKIVNMQQRGNRLDLDSLTVFGYQFTRVKGPFRLYDRRLIVGAEEALRPVRRGSRPPRIDPSRRLTAKAIGGDFTFDAEVRFGKPSLYHLLITMNRARLEHFARRYLPGTTNLKGIMYGRLELAGKGDSTADLRGSGSLLISPAALYELPVLVQVFKVLNFVQPDKTAFTFAYARFDVLNRRVLFRLIDLVGDAISLRGRGTADFNGRLALDFYSMLPRNRIPIFLLRQLVNSATAGWVGVEVRGTTRQPVARVRAIPQVEDALKRFLQGLGGRPPAGLRRGPVAAPP